MPTKKRCGNCTHCGADPDGAFCGHPDSLKVSAGFGQGIILARSKEGVCGPAGNLFERCVCIRKECPRHD